jgi:hypothetical protein
MNSVKGEVPLVLSDGRNFKLVLDFEAMLSIEDVTGKPLAQVMRQAGEGFVTSRAAVAQAAFSRHHPEVTRADVIAMLFSEEKLAVEVALARAAEAAFPDVSAEGKAEAPAKPKRQAGKTSGRSGAKRA